MYTEKNYRNKKAVIQDLEAGVPIYVFQPGPFGAGTVNPESPSREVVCYLEGPHYPEPHRWYARGTYDIRTGRLLSLHGTSAGVDIVGPGQYQVRPPMRRRGCVS